MFNYVRGFALRAWIFCLLVSRVSWLGLRVRAWGVRCAYVRVYAGAFFSVPRGAPI